MVTKERDRRFMAIKKAFPTFYSGRETPVSNAKFGLFLHFELCINDIIATISLGGLARIR